MHGGKSERASLKVGGLCEATRDLIFAVTGEITRKVMRRCGFEGQGVQFTEDRDELLRIAREFEKYGQSSWAPGGPVSNTLHMMGVCQKSLAHPLALHWMGPVGIKECEHRPHPIDSLRRVSIIPYCVVHKNRDGLALCVVSAESRTVTSTLVHQSTATLSVHPDWPNMDVFVATIRDLSRAEKGLLASITQSHSLALLVGDQLAMDEKTFALVRDLAASNRLKWMIGRLEELVRLKLMSLDTVHQAFRKVEIVGTQGAHPVVVWNPYNEKMLKLDVSVAKTLPENDLGAGDAYAGGYLYLRILKNSIEEAHEFGTKCGRRVLEVTGARIEPENDLNLLFGNLIHRESSDRSEGRLYDRVRVTPGITVVSGGQTGVDQEALRVGSQLGLPSFCVLPKDRRTEVAEGLFQGPDDFGDSHITELGSASYRYRTWLTAFLGDGMLVWDFHGSEGSEAAREACRVLGRPFLEITNIDGRDLLPQVVQWSDRHQVRVLNIAGNRGSLLNEEQRTLVKSQLYQILKSLAWHRAQTNGIVCRSHFPSLLSRRKDNDPDKYQALRIGLPNVAAQRTLFERFLSEVFGLLPTERRRLVASYRDPELTIVFARSRDLPRMLRQEIVDLIFCGRDLLQEESLDASILLNTGLFLCLLVLVGKVRERRTKASEDAIRVGSQYPSLAPRLLKGVQELALKGEILDIHGTAEAWINAGFIDAAVDTWRTGATADANGLGLLRVFGSTSLVAACLPAKIDSADGRMADFVDRLSAWLAGKQG